MYQAYYSDLPKFGCHLSWYKQLQIIFYYVVLRSRLKWKLRLCHRSMAKFRGIFSNIARKAIRCDTFCQKTGMARKSEEKHTSSKGTWPKRRQAALVNTVMNRNCSNTNRILFPPVKTNSILIEYKKMINLFNMGWLKEKVNQRNDEVTEHPTNIILCYIRKQTKFTIRCPKLKSEYDAVKKRLSAIMVEGRC